MDLNDMLEIRAVCEAGSLRRAAKALGISQPTLSHHLAYLEDKLGAPLFIRHHSRSEPTALARFIAERAASIGRETQFVSSEIERLARGQTGLVRLGVGPVISRTLLTELILAVADAHPRISLSVTVAMTQSLVERMEARDLDVLICYPVARPVPTLEQHEEFEVQNIVVAHPSHEVFRGKLPTFAELGRYPAALVQPEEPYRALMLGLGIDFDVLEGRCICSDFDVVVRLVTSGPRYITAGPAYLFAPEIEAGRLRAIDARVPLLHRVAMYCNRDAYPLPAVAQVRSIVRQVLPGLVARKQSVTSRASRA